MIDCQFVESKRIGTHPSGPDVAVQGLAGADVVGDLDLQVPGICAEIFQLGHGVRTLAKK